MEQSRQRSVDRLCTALEMEEKGRAFYEKAYQASENPLGKEIFRTLIDDEIIHRDRIQKIYDSLNRDQKWTEDWKALQCAYTDLGEVFRNLAVKYSQSGLSHTGDVEALKLAHDFELRSVEFYENQLAQADDPLEQAFLVQMIAEEKAHSRALQDTVYYLSDPEGWTMEKERAGLDGV